jgi:hypothetical protein
MKTITKVQYEAFDGQLFDSQITCEEYERLQNHPTSFDIHAGVKFALRSDPQGKKFGVIILVAYGVSCKWADQKYLFMTNDFTLYAIEQKTSVQALDYLIQNDYIRVGGCRLKNKL